MYHVITNKDWDNLARHWYDLLYVSPDEEEWDKELVCAGSDDSFYVKIETFGAYESEYNAYKKVVVDNGALIGFSYYEESTALHYNSKYKSKLNDR